MRTVVSVVRRPVLACLLAVVLAVAGCSGDTARIGDAPETTPTATPAPVPSPTPTPAPSPLPPGVERTGIEDPWALTTTHREILANESHTLHVEETTRDPNGTVRWRRSRVARVDGDREVAIIDREGRPALHDRYPYPEADRVELYVEGYRVFAAVSTDDGTDYRTFPRQAGNRRDLYMLLSSVETRVPWKAQRNGTTVYRIEATDGPAADRLRYVEGVRDARDVTLRLLVDARGVIRTRHLSYTATVDGRQVHYERTVRVTALGETTVERPPWTDRLRETDGRTDRESGAATGRGATAP